MRARLSLFVLTLVVVAFALPDLANAGRRRRDHESAGSQTYASPQSNPIAVCANKNLVFVASTTSNRVDVIDTLTQTNVGHVVVGMEPVGLAVKPDGVGGCGDELWVANHVSDSVSVIDIAPASASYLQVVETVQDVDPDTLVTAFDEPVGIAFKGDGSQAYVTLSSTNQVAVVDTATYAVTQTLFISAQDPRAIAVRNGRLYVAAFESSNKTEVSACASLIATGGIGSQCSLGLANLSEFITDPNLPGEIKNIVVDPQVPDRDLFVFDTANLGAAPTVVTGVGTLLYGLAVDASGNVYVTQADARNAANGNQDLNLIDLDNRMFFNRVAKVACGGGSCGAPTQFELDPPVGSPPTPGTQLATPYGIGLSADGSTVVATAAGSSRIFSMTSAGTILDRLDVGAIPFGIAFDSPSGATGTAWVLNTLDNSVTRVSVGPGGTLTAGATIPVGADPTPAEVRRGRIAFNNADGSTEGTFSCGSCHPFGNTDQLLWRIGGACFFGDCDGHDEPRTTMPVRGLRDTLPLHWDGTLGDPFGGSNGAVGGNGSGGSDCALGDADGDHDCFRDLVDESFAGVMCDQSGACPTCDPVAGTCQPGALLSHQEREDMAFFLASVSYPPARSRRGDDALTASATQGFKDFFMDQGGLVNEPNTCADSNAGCHELPIGTSTNSETLAGFDAPTMRGMTDRFIHFSLGVTGTEEILAQANNALDLTSFGVPIQFDGLNSFGIPWDPANVGYSEITTFGAAFLAFQGVYGMGPLDIFQMFEEASTGHSGAVGRQVMLNNITAAGCSGPGTCEVERMLDALEAADARGVINLRGNGLSTGSKVEVSYEAATDVYRVGTIVLSRATMIDRVQDGSLLVALTGHLRSGVNTNNPQPLIAPEDANCGTGNGGTGDPKLPSGSSFTIETRHVDGDDAVFIDGQHVPGATLTVQGGTPSCGEQTDTIVSVNTGGGLVNGMHLLQVQARNAAGVAGLLSNEMPFCVGPSNQCN